MTHRWRQVELDVPTRERGGVADEVQVGACYQCPSGTSLDFHGPELT
jgi:hypothetical protein